MIRIKLILALFSLSLFGGELANAQAWKELVGFNALVAEKGSGLEDGAGVSVVQPEAGSATSYMPDDLNSQFSGKTFTDPTGASTGSFGHATNVGYRLYGNTSGMAPGITDITGYNADYYVDTILGHTSGVDPAAQNGADGMGFNVGNHSYIGFDSLANNIDYLERFDFVINRDNTVMVVGANNSGSTPDLLAPSYNAITVGKSNGTHSTGLTSDYGLPRFKPDLVAPEGATSYSTPLVAGAAAILRQAGAGTNMIQNEVIKSAILAGATKEEFAGWSRTSTQPIDSVYGHGELNILNSYHIWEGGEFDGSEMASTAPDIGHFGWDYGDFDGTNDLYYDFEIPGNLNFRQLSASLVWNVDITDNDADVGVFDASSVLADLDLRLFDSGGILIDSSVSTDYNTEHIYLTNLATGNYTFQISGDIATDFGFSWRIHTVPEPSGMGLVGVLVVLTLRRNRRR